MKILVIATDGFEDTELLYPIYRLKEAGIEVKIASDKQQSIEGKHEYKVNVDLALDSVKVDDYAGLLLPGGKSPERIRTNPKAVELTAAFVNGKKPVGAICHGPQLLISAKACAGRKMTCYKGIKDDVVAAGAKFEDREVVVDSNIVTSRVPEDLPAFMREFLKLLNR